MSNVIDACKTHNAKLVFFDNTYMYPQTAEPQTEDILFEPHGRKGQVRADIAQELICAQTEKDIVALIARAPEFYGPERTQSITQSTLIEPLKRGKKARVFLRDDTQRTLIYTPDASRALALLGNTPDAFDQTGLTAITFPIAAWLKRLKQSHKSPTLLNSETLATKIGERFSKTCATHKGNAALSSR